MSGGFPAIGSRDAKRLHSTKVSLILWRDVPELLRNPDNPRPWHCNPECAAAVPSLRIIQNRWVYGYWAQCQLRVRSGHEFCGTHEKIAARNRTT